MEAQLPHLLLMQEWAVLVVEVVAEVLYQWVKVVLAAEEEAADLAGMLA